MAATPKGVDTRRSRKFPRCPGSVRHGGQLVVESLVHVTDVHRPSPGCLSDVP